MPRVSRVCQSKPLFTLGLVAKATCFTGKHGRGAEFIVCIGFFAYTWGALFLGHA